MNLGLIMFLHTSPHKNYSNEHIKSRTWFPNNIPQQKGPHGLLEKWLSLGLGLQEEPIAFVVPESNKEVLKKQKRDMSKRTDPMVKAEQYEQ